MINIKKKEDCVGCGACVQRCPKSCIEMHEDKQGFLYPKVDTELCIDCHLCERVCPVINQAEPRKPLKVYAAKNTDEAVRLASSSGGVFFALAKNVIERGGVVFGARFNEDWEVVHGYAETIDGVKAFQGSKYVQSRIGDSYRQAETFLKAGRMVMFTGTPCQLSGLRLFLRKDYGEQLLSVDVVCHGVPSPLVWREYLKYLTRPKGASAGKNTVFQSLNELPVITGISFRDKRLGWEKFGFSVRVSATCGSGQNSVFQSGKHNSEEQELLFEPLGDNLFMRAFLNNLCLRPSCYACPAKCGKSLADFTLADFWGIGARAPQLYDKSGVSLILDYSGCVTASESIMASAVSYDDALAGNPSIEQSVAVPRLRETFWRIFHTQGIDKSAAFLLKLKPPFLQRCRARITRLMPESIKQALKSILK